MRITSLNNSHAYHIERIGSSRINRDIMGRSNNMIRRDRSYNFISKGDFVPTDHKISLVKETDQGSHIS